MTAPRSPAVRKSTIEITVQADSTFNRPTFRRPLYLRATAPSCNADPTVIERRTIIITGPNGERGNYRHRNGGGFWHLSWPRA